ncbi:MAG: hypothetical protein JWN99_1331 [Ilumatobacteraceae bacterium]|nr:hypothetical protein [Ilumatobacteraceae bacterium]
MFALTVVFAIVVAIPIARRSARPRGQVVLAFASVERILAVTLVGRVRKLSTGIAARARRRSLAHVTRRPAIAFAALVVGSLAIEFVQRRYGLGAADPADLVANTFGAGVGVVAGISARQVGATQTAPMVDTLTN